MKSVVLYLQSLRQGCKRDIEVRDRDETETFGLQYETRPRPYHFSRDRDRDVQSGVRDETETLIGRDRDIFRDLGTLSFLSEVFLPCISFSSKLTKFKNSEVCSAEPCLCVCNVTKLVVLESIVCKSTGNSLLPSKLIVPKF